MAKVVLLPAEPSSVFEEKILSLNDGTSIRLGRCHAKESVSSSNGLLPHSFQAVSYHHAKLTFLNGEFFIKDTSRNGTFINGYRIAKNELHSLSSGDIIQLASESFSSIGIVEAPAFYIKLFKPEDHNFSKMLEIQEQFGEPLQLFLKYPNFKCDLESLHLFVRERFKALKILDGLGDLNFRKKEQILNVLSLMKEKHVPYVLKLVTGTSETFDEEFFLQKLDLVSHYMICLSCCQNYVLKKWFIDQEIKLLRIRWFFLHEIDKSKVIAKLFSSQKVSLEEKMKLVNASKEYICQNLEYYKFHFTSVSPLLKTREIFIENGFCFVEKDSIVFALATCLTESMKKNLQIIHTNLHHIWNDERITSIIHYIVKEIQFERYIFDNGPGSRVSLSDLDKLAEESFPLCMNELHFNLKKHFHLKNAGRFQYGLFLKTIGLSLQDSVKFWRHYFTKKMTLDEFLKNYHYHILHLYGVVGKMANYPPQSCKKIMAASPSFDEYHGCPFKVIQNDVLKPVLKRNGINNESSEKIIELVGKGTPQLACKMYFNFKHDIELRDAPYHPNQYFNESRKAMLSRQPSSSSKDTARKEKSIPSSSQQCVCSGKYEW